MNTGELWQPTEKLVPCPVCSNRNKPVELQPVYEIQGTQYYSLNIKCVNSGCNFTVGIGLSDNTPISAYGTLSEIISQTWNAAATALILCKATQSE